MNNTPERRIKPRVTCDYPVIVEGYDLDGNRFDERGKLANLSASGLFLKANRYIDNGSKISVTVLLTSNLIEKDTPKIATNGIVVRIEPQADGSCGVAVKFNSYRFI
jgi:hypothetical protein